MKYKYRKRAGFTLIELLVVVLIIGILAAVALPLYNKSVERSHAAEGMTIVSSLAKAGKMYTMTANQDPQLAKWSELDINYTVAQPDQTTATSQTIGNNWSCRFYDSYVACDRQGGSISYELGYWTDASNLLACMAGTDAGKSMCQALGCQYAGALAGTSTYKYNCNQPGSTQLIPNIPPTGGCPPPQTICQECPPCTPTTVCPDCGTPPCPCYSTPCVCTPQCTTIYYAC